MADEPSLPNLPLAEPEKPLSNGARSRRRVKLHGTSPVVSSDPPFFSSDDDPSAENYAGSHGRQKRKFRGPWYSQQPEGLEGRRPKRTLQRQFDSAVWLGSDDTEADDDAEFSSRIQVSGTHSNGHRPIALRPAAIQGSVNLVPKGEPTPEELANKEIELCLETGKEDIDLAARGLTYLSNAAIKSLSTIVSIPMSSQGQSYHPLRPKLKLFLSSNNLRRVPGELLNLDNVTVLSLRSNLLVELPSAIGRLHRLVELSVANNNLHFLPYEILRIFSGESKLHSLSLHPNPFYEAETADSNPYKGGEPYPPDLRDGVISRSGRPGAVASILPEVSHKWNVTYKFRSQVRFMNRDGTLAKGPHFPKDESLFCSPPRQSNASYYSHHFGRSNLIPVAPIDDVPEPPTSSFDGKQASKAPSLLEVALSTWSRSHHLPELEQWLGYDPPERLARLTEDARALRETEADSRNCTICARRFVIPRTEWIEWWQISKVQESNGIFSAASPLRRTENRRDQVESMVPLIRRGCNWRCLPDNVQPADPIIRYDGS